MPKPKADLSVLVVARNEERRLERCLRSASFAREIVVVLDRTTDRSAEVARCFGARILSGSWPVEADRRNTGIDFCTSKWILELDADERISDQLSHELPKEICKSQYDYYLIPFSNYIGQARVTYGWGAYNGVVAKPCLFKKGTKVWGPGEIHPPVTLQGRASTLSAHIDHFIDDDVASVIDRLNRYTALAALKVVREHQKLHTHITLRRFFTRFFKVYCQRRGYKEGWRGVLLALFSGLYPVLTHIKALELREIHERHDI